MSVFYREILHCADGGKDASSVALKAVALTIFRQLPSNLKMEETNWLPDVLDSFLLLEDLQEPLFLDVSLPSSNEEVLQPEPANHHEDNLKYKCPKCPKSFAFPSRLQRHLSTHQVRSQLNSRQWIDHSFSRYIIF